MPLIYMRKLLLLLLAMVLLPMHVSAAQVDQTLYLPHFSKLQPFVAGNTTSNADVDFSVVSEQSTQVPVSEGHNTSDTLAIIDPQRRASNLREGLDEGDVDSIGDLNSPFYATVEDTYRLVAINWHQNQSVFCHLNSEHRISGWKETNAMYVALNSQFSV